MHAGNGFVSLLHNAPHHRSELGYHSSNGCGTLMLRDSGRLLPRYQLAALLLAGAEQRKRLCNVANLILAGEERNGGIEVAGAHAVHRLNELRDLSRDVTVEQAGYCDYGEHGERGPEE